MQKYRCDVLKGISNCKQILRFLQKIVRACRWYQTIVVWRNIYSYKSKLRKTETYRKLNYVSFQNPIKNSNSPSHFNAGLKWMQYKGRLTQIYTHPHVLAFSYMFASQLWKCISAIFAFFFCWQILYQKLFYHHIDKYNGNPRLYTFNMIVTIGPKDSLKLKCFLNITLLL